MTHSPEKIFQAEKSNFLSWLAFSLRGYYCDKFAWHIILLYSKVFIENDGRFTIDFSWSLSGPSKPLENKTAWNSSTNPVSISTHADNNVLANTKVSSIVPSKAPPYRRQRQNTS